MISNESETDSNPRKRQGTLLSFFTNPMFTMRQFVFIHQYVQSCLSKNPKYTFYTIKSSHIKPNCLNHSFLILRVSNPRKRQGTLLSFFTNPIVKKSKADTKVKKHYDRNDTRKIKNEWFKQFE
jgi:hypothetical protein